MKYFVLEYDMSELDPEAKILFETEADSLTEAMKLVKVRPNCEYEVVTDQDIIAEIEKYYEVESFLH